MEKKNQLIKSLFDQGKITFEQALLLASQQESAVENLMYYDTGEDEVLTNMINSIYDNLINIEDTRIHVESIVKIMNDRNWTWKDKPVTVARFKSYVYSQVTQVVTHLYHVYQKEQERNEDENYDIYGGGVRISGTLTTDNNIEVTLEFILETSTSFYDLQDEKAVS